MEENKFNIDFDKIKKIEEEVGGDYYKWNSLQDYQDFVDKYDIESKPIFRSFGKIYSRYKRVISSDEKKLLKFKKVIRRDFSQLTSIEEVQKFIDENHIQTYSEFRENYGRAYVVYLDLVDKDSENTKLNFPPQPEKEDPYVTKEDFEKFLKDNQIEYLSDFRKKHSYIYGKYLEARKNWDGDDLVFSERESTAKYKDLRTLEDFQRYVDENKIQSSKDLRKDQCLYSWFFRMISTKEERSKLKFPIETRECHVYGDSYTTIDEFQKFVDDNNISKATDFKDRFESVYGRFCRIIPEKDRHKLKYKTELNYHDSKYFSYGENYLINIFEDLNIEFVTQKTYPDLRNINPLRYDFYLIDYNILIEYHGSQHFSTDEEDWVFDKKELSFNDRKKYDYAINNKIPILYFTLNKKSYEKFGYFTEVITDSKILINKIKEIGMTNQPQ